MNTFGETRPRPGNAWPYTFKVLPFIAYGILIVIWSIAIRYNDAPDEETHFFLVEYLYRFHSMPTPLHDPSVPFVGLLSGEQFSRATFWYFGLPYTHSILATGYSALFAPFMPPGSGYLAARAFNWTLGPLFLVLLYAVARAAGLSRQPALYVTFLIALIPQVTFIFSYLNADAFALTTTTAALAALLWLIRAPNKKRAVLSGVALGALLTVKVYYFPAIAFFLGLFVVLGVAKTRIEVWRYLPYTAVSACLVGVPILLVTYIQFGEVLGFKGQASFVALHAGNAKQSAGTCYVFCQDRPFHLAELTHWAGDTFKSFFMTLGWLDIKLPAWVYWVVFAPMVVALFFVSQLSLVTTIRNRNYGLAGSLWDGAIVVLFWLMLIGTTSLSLLGSQNLIPQPQGRYLFVVLPFAALLIARLMARSSFFGAGDSAERYTPRAMIVLALAFVMFATNLGSLATLVRHGGGRYPDIGIGSGWPG